MSDKIIITQELLETWEPEIRNLVSAKLKINMPIERRCLDWAYGTCEFLVSKGISSKDLTICLGKMLICVNNVTQDFRPTNDKGEGYYWGYDPFQVDAKPDEIHAWVLYKNHLIDYTCQFFEFNFKEAQPFLGNDKMYQWQRTPLPKVLFCRNFTYTKLRREHGLRYEEMRKMEFENISETEIRD